MCTFARVQFSLPLNATTLKESSDQISQESDREAESTSSAARHSPKRARSITVFDDDQTEAGDLAPIFLGKRRKTCDASKLQTPVLSSPPEQAGKARADLSPATEAVIHQMRDDIKKAIKTLKSISKCVDGLLEFKAILDYKQLEIDHTSATIGRRGPQCDINDQYQSWPWS
jgi:hypothetical protein